MLYSTKRSTVLVNKLSQRWRFERVGWQFFGMKVTLLVGAFQGEHKAERVLRLTGLLGLPVSISRTAPLRTCMMG